MTKHPRPNPIVTRLETYAPDGTVIARMDWHYEAEQGAQAGVSYASPWTLSLFPGAKGAIHEALGVWERDGQFATKARTVEEARTVLDYATHAVLTMLEKREDMQATLTAQIDKATTMAAEHVLPIEGLL